MNKFQKYFLMGEECIQMYPACSAREEMNELLWALETCIDHRLARGFTPIIRDAVKDGYDIFEHASDEVVQWTVDDLFNLFAEVAASRGCVFMMHPDHPGVAFLMTRQWYEKEFADD